MPRTSFRYAVLSFDVLEEEGRVSFTPDFDNAVRIQQLDALRDWIVDLQDRYDSILNTPPAPAAAPQAEG